MKKLFAILFSVTVFVSCCFAFTGCTPRSELLKLYMPGEYIDEEIFEEFEEWYFDMTGKTVHVKLELFDEVEQIATALEYDHADYDLLCPSDYMVEHLIKNEYLLKVDTARVNVKNIIRPEYIERAKISDPTLEYSVPYMYGTFGIMYDYEKTQKHIDSWSAIFTDEYKDFSANKDSLREAISSAAIWANRDELAALSDNFDDYNLEYGAKLQEIYEDVSDNALKRAIDALKEAKNYNSIWGGEDLKFNMATNSTSIKVALTWSCDAGYVMSDEFEDEDGNVYPGNKNLWYVVPKEGGNIYLDNFVISKFAKNVDAAQYFLEFICQKEIAMANSIYAGAISPVKSAYQQLLDDYTYKFDMNPTLDEDWVAMYMDMLFPSNETLARCGTMRDYGENDAKVSLAWNDVKF